MYKRQRWHGFACSSRVPRSRQVTWNCTVVFTCARANDNVLPIYMRLRTVHLVDSDSFVSFSDVPIITTSSKWLSVLVICQSDVFFFRQNLRIPWIDNNLLTCAFLFRKRGSISYYFLVTSSLLLQLLFRSSTSRASSLLQNSVPRYLRVRPPLH